MEQLYISWMHGAHGGLFRLMYPAANQIVDVPEFGWESAEEYVEGSVMNILRRLRPGLPRGSSSSVYIKVEDESLPEHLINPSRQSMFEARLTAADPSPEHTGKFGAGRWYYAVRSFPPGWHPDEEDQEPWNLNEILECVEHGQHKWRDDPVSAQPYCERCLILEGGGYA